METCGMRGDVAHTAPPPRSTKDKSESDLLAKRLQPTFSELGSIPVDMSLGGMSSFVG